MILLLILPVLCFILLFCLWYGHTGKVRVSFVNTILLMGAVLWCSTEALSSVKMINLPGIAVTWSVVLIVLFFIFIKRGGYRGASKDILEKLKSALADNKLLLVIPVFLTVSFFVAIIYPPNNFDSMTYHMARVGHWILRESIGHYPTHILRQLIQPPFSEWMLLHMQVLVGGDRFANTMQTFFFGACIVQVSLIAQLLGGSRKQQVLSALFTCLIPMAIIQSNTTQNDVAVAFFILAFAYYTIKICKGQELKIADILLAGISMGLAILTKGTAYLYCLVFSCWYLLVVWRYLKQSFHKIIPIIGLLSLIPLTALIINSGHFYRNYSLNASILGKGNEGVSNEAHEIKPLILVGIKNFMNHMPVSGGMKDQVRKYAGKAGLDPDDPKYNFQTMDFMITGGQFSYHEDYAQNFWHAIYIILFGFLLVAARKFLTRNRTFELFALTTYVTIIAFCFLFKWQPWGNRLETSLFMLFCIVFGMIAGQYRSWVQFVFLLPLFYTGAKSILYNGNHPILPWKENIFNTGYDSYIFNKPEYLEEKVFFDSSSLKKIGLRLGADSWDYPYYKMLSESKDNFTLAHVYVENESRKLDTGFVPDAFLTYEINRTSDTIAGKTYYRSRIFGNRMALFEVLK